MATHSPIFDPSFPHIHVTSMVLAVTVGWFLLGFFSLFDLDIPTSCSILFTDFRTVFVFAVGHFLPLVIKFCRHVSCSKDFNGKIFKNGFSAIKSAWNVLLALPEEELLLSELNLKILNSDKMSTMGGAVQACCKFNKTGHCEFGQNCLLCCQLWQEVSKQAPQAMPQPCQIWRVQDWQQLLLPSLWQFE